MNVEELECEILDAAVEVVNDEGCVEIFAGEEVR